MNEQNLLTLFFIDSQGNENYGLALVPGKYLAQSDAIAKTGYLIIFMCVNSDNIFAFYYVDSAGKYIEHSLLHSGEESIDYVLLEAWLRFDILPHYWILTEETKFAAAVDRCSKPEYTKTYARLKEILSRFRWTEISKAKTFDNSQTLEPKNSNKGESKPLFSPDIPSEILTPLTL